MILSVHAYLHDSVVLVSPYAPGFSRSRNKYPLTLSPRYSLSFETLRYNTFPESVTVAMQQSLNPNDVEHIGCRCVGWIGQARLIDYSNKSLQCKNTAESLSWFSESIGAIVKVCSLPSGSASMSAAHVKLVVP